MQSANVAPPAGFGVFVRTWQNGNLIDEHLLCRVKSFEEATAVSQKLTNNRVRLNNDDVTVSIEPLSSVEQASESPDAMEQSLH